MTKRDLSQVIKIEKASFEQPYSREIFEQELQIKAARVWVATYRRKILGYIDYWIIREEMELVSIAVHPKYQGRGVAWQLMDHMMAAAEENEIQRITLDVRASNSSAQGLYGRFGFVKVGLRKRYYSDKGEDAWIMRKSF